MPSELQDKMMTQNTVSIWKSSKGVLIAYIAVAGLALGLDTLTDRSFGALMLSTLPISFIALACLLVGPYLKGARKSATLRSWLTGTIIVLAISIAFSLIGSDQAKTGELIFTYAAMIMALPSSLILPFVATWLEPILGGSVFIRIIVAWIVCIAAGMFQWVLLKWLYAGIQNGMRKD